MYTQWCLLGGVRVHISLIQDTLLVITLPLSIHFVVRYISLVIKYTTWILPVYYV